MKPTKRVIIVLFIFNQCIAHGNPKNDSVLRILNEEITKREYYFAKKEKKINELRHRFQNVSEKEEIYHASRNLYKSYISYDYDSAYYYAQKAYMLSLELNDPFHLIKAKYDQIYCYLSAGLFMEAYDLLTSIDVVQLPESQKYRYYNLHSLLYSKMGSYSQDVPKQEKYIKEAMDYIDTALEQLDKNTMTYDLQDAYKYFLQKDINSEEKIQLYNKLIDKYEIHIENNAAIASNLGELYYKTGNIEKAIYYLALAATTDIRNAIRETTAMSTLASYLYYNNDIEAASKYIYVALEDANFYNARQRKLAINDILPFIEKDRITYIQKQKSKLFHYLLSVSALIILLSITLFVIYRQKTKLSSAKSALNAQLQKVSSMYDELEESNRIKDQQIFQALYKKSDYLEQVEILLKRMDRKLKSRQYNDINSLYKEFNLKSERELIHHSFDKAFLKLFPNFLEGYNKLLQPNNQAFLDEKGSLPPEIRIFALMRIGINDNEQIAKFLNLSLNTIYTYKTRAKNKAIISKEDFEEEIMKIDKRK